MNSRCEFRFLEWLCQLIPLKTIWNYTYMLKWLTSYWYVHKNNYSKLQITFEKLFPGCCFVLEYLPTLWCRNDRQTWFRKLHRYRFRSSCEIISFMSSIYVSDLVKITVSNCQACLCLSIELTRRHRFLCSLRQKEQISKHSTILPNTFHELKVDRRCWTSSLYACMQL